MLISRSAHFYYVILLILKMDMEAGEVLDEVEDNESPEKKKDLFPKTISLLDEPQPKKKKNNMFVLNVSVMKAAVAYLMQLYHCS